MKRTTADRDVMVDEPRLRTRVVRYLKERDGAECTVEEVAAGTGLREEQVLAGIDHNHFVDNLRPNLYYGVIQKIEKGSIVTYRFNKVQYQRNRSRWIDAGGKRRGRNGGGGGGPELTMPRFGWLRRKGKE